MFRVTHDIKEHLAAIQSCIDPVIGGIIGPLNERQKDLLRRADERTEKLLFFIKALLEITRIKLSKELKMEYFSFKDALSDKYTPHNGKIDVRVSDKGNSILMEIADTGIGIPKDELPRIFEEFYRASNAKEVERDGTGLGLSIAKQIVERHNGKIWVESEEGKGSIFSIELPK